MSKPVLKPCRRPTFGICKPIGTRREVRASQYLPAHFQMTRSAYLRDMSVILRSAFTLGSSLSAWTVARAATEMNFVKLDVRRSRAGQEQRRGRVVDNVV